MPPEACARPEIHLLGEIVVAFGNLELSLEVAIWQLLVPAADDVSFLMAQTLTAQMSFERRVKAFESMYRQKNRVAGTEELERVVKALRAAEETRNQLLHSAWVYAGSREEFFRIKASVKKGLRHQFHRVTPQRMRDALSRIVAAGQRLGHFNVLHVQPQEGSTNR